MQLKNIMIIGIFSIGATCCAPKLSSIVPERIAKTSTPIVSQQNAPNPSVNPSQVATEISLNITDLLPEGSLTPTLTTATPEIKPQILPFFRPIAPPGRNYIDPTYRFGSTQNGLREPHHGVEFLNTTGTPVLAAYAGTVFYAGDDTNSKDFGPYTNFYGQFIVLTHHLTGYPAPFYTLYAHLSKIQIEKGDIVNAGDQIGLVGLSGAATGSHLHFEIRRTPYGYNSVFNPELWLKPRKIQKGIFSGAIAGQIQDQNDNFIKVDNISITNLETGIVSYVSTYEDSALVGTNPWKENFAIGDLYPGTYEITFITMGLQIQEADVNSGEVTVVSFILGESKSP